MILTPEQEIPLTLFFDNQKIPAILLELSPDALFIRCTDYFDKYTQLQFLNAYFKGKGTVIHVDFNQKIFHYKVSIDEIQFKPGILINQII